MSLTQRSGNITAQLAIGVVVPIKLDCFAILRELKRDPRCRFYFDDVVAGLMRPERSIDLQMDTDFLEKLLQSKDEQSLQMLLYHARIPSTYSSIVVARCLIFAVARGMPLQSSLCVVEEHLVLPPKTLAEALVHETAFFESLGFSEKSIKLFHIFKDLT